MMEQHLRRALLLSRGDFGVFLDRPISAITLALTAALLTWACWTSIRESRRKAAAFVVADSERP
jgi:TctA family transporter